MSTKPYEFTGKIHYIGRTQTFPSGFAKRTLVLVQDAESRYPDYAAFDFLRTKNADNTADLNRFAVGQTVKVKFYVSASESKKSPGSWFVNTKAVGIEAVGGAATATQPAPLLPTGGQDANAADCDGFSDDLPF